MADPGIQSPTLGHLNLALSVSSPFEAIEELCAGLGETLELSVSLRISAAAIARESLAPTCLGYDIALPHARLSNCDVFTLSIGRLAAPLYWGPDKKPVRFVFLAVVPSHLASAYLGLVKTLSKAAKENRIQKVLAEAVEPDAAGSLIRSILALK